MLRRISDTSYCHCFVSAQHLHPSSIAAIHKRLRSLHLPPISKLFVQDKNNPTRPPGTPQTQRRFVKFGGGISSEQVCWLRSQCSSARNARQRIVIFCHQPVHPETCYGACLLWNYQTVLDIVHEFRDICVATFAGHAHQVRFLLPVVHTISAYKMRLKFASRQYRPIRASWPCKLQSKIAVQRCCKSILDVLHCCKHGWYWVYGMMIKVEKWRLVQDGEIVDRDGVYHRVFRAVVETPIDQDCNGIINMSETGLQLIGEGYLTSASVVFSQYWQKASPAPAALLLPAVFEASVINSYEMHTNWRNCDALKHNHLFRSLPCLQRQLRAWKGNCSLCERSW